MDSHRPFYHGNLIEHSRIFIVDDNNIDFENAPSQNDIDILETEAGDE